MSGRGGNTSIMLGSSLCGFVFKSVWWNLAHRSRTGTISRNTVSSSFLTNCALSRLFPFKLCDTLHVPIEPSPVVVRWQSFGFGELLFKIGMNSCGNDLQQVRIYDPQCLPQYPILALFPYRDIICCLFYRAYKRRFATFFLTV